MICEVANFEPQLPFHAFLRNVHSQCGEDGLLEYLLNRAELAPGYFIEFGAWDGRHLSNCAKLADERWPGCFIEGDAARFAQLKREYGERPDVLAVNAYVSTKGANSLDAILRRHKVPAEPTVLSIDIDGNDYHVWASLAEHQPAICIVEFNPTISARVSYVQEDDVAIQRGASLRALWQLGTSKDYELVAATEWNAFFMRGDICRRKAVQTYTPEQVKSSKYETFIFHGYDGTLFTAGAKSLLWHDISFSPTELQILPEHLRHFPPTAPTQCLHALDRLKKQRKAGT